MMPDGKVLGNSVIAGIALRPWFVALNDRIRGTRWDGMLANLQIGH